MFSRIRILICLIAALVLAPGATALGDDFKLEEGFTPMFNGSDFSGWQFDQTYGLPSPAPANWSVADGVIRLSGGGRPHIGSQWDYQDFDMRFQWRGLRAKYNSGFYIRSNRKVGNNQINLAKGDEGHFFGGKMTGGGKASPGLQKPPMEWNEWRIVMEGGGAKFYCNGKLAWEGTEFGSPRGHIGFQAEGAPLEFRRLRIKELGWRSLSDPKKWARAKPEHWKKDPYGLLFAPRGVVRLRAPNAPDNWVLRLEWRSAQGVAGDVGVINGTKLTMVHLNNPDGVVVAGVKQGEIVDNPLGQWNYLQLSMKDDRLTVWQNGKDLVSGHDTTKGQAVDGGFLLLRVKQAGLEFRNLRIRDLN